MSNGGPPAVSSSWVRAAPSRHQDEGASTERKGKQIREDGDRSTVVAAAPLIATTTCDQTLATTTLTATTCVQALSAAASTQTPLYLASLPADVLAIVDRLITLNAWRWAGALTPLSVPEPPPEYYVGFEDRVISEGEDLLVRVVCSDSAATYGKVRVGFR